MMNIVIELVPTEVNGDGAETDVRVAALFVCEFPTECLFDQVYKVIPHTTGRRSGAAGRS
jgi:hypothetical protein